MTCHNKETLEQMLFDVVNELDLSDVMVDEHGQHGTEPAVLVRLVLEQKNKTIRLLKAGFADAANTTQHDPSKPIACAFCGAISMTVPIKPTHTQELQKQLRELDDEGYQPSTGAIGNKTADALAFHEKELARLRERDLAQQARIAGLRGALERTLPRLHGELYLDHPEVKDIEKVLATTDDLSALKAHDDALIELIALKAECDYHYESFATEIRSLKR